ncbi:hypothetical protein [Peribacillus kribbensis]|uniref:hypothetical protein n=1 Tax=Peribacillus kribbensis TaxID=356658 RepID=UPI00040805E7|nr:hypothetical protein [Peribacillus kribbensis]
MSFIGIVIIIVLVYFLIIKPMTQRNRNQGYGPGGPYNQNQGYDPRYNPNQGYDPGRSPYNQNPNQYGPAYPGGMGGYGSGMGRFGTFAGGLAAGALLSYLFEQGRIGFDQFQSLQGLGDHELLRELEDQNILQQDEINQLRDEIGQDGGSQDDGNAHEDQNGSNEDNGPNDQQNDTNGGSWDDNSDDNWL